MLRWAYIYLWTFSISAVLAAGPGQWPVDDAQWPRGPGNLIEPQGPNRELVDRLKQIDPARLRSNIEKLVSFGTRSTLSTQTDPTRGIGAARDWIAAEMKSYGGRLNVSTIGYVQQPVPRIPSPTLISDVIATLPGWEEPDRVYLVSGHYDSRNTDVLDGEGDAPGADDDASGVAVSMELARIFADAQPRATIIFTAVAGEEQGLYGSAYLAKELKAAGKDVQGMLNNDIVGSPKADDGSSDPNFIRMFVAGIPSASTSDQIAQYLRIGAENDSPTRQLGRFVREVTSNDVTGISVEMVYRPDRYLRGGDHTPFINEGFPAVRFTEPNEDYAHQHQDVREESGVQYGDLLEFIDFEYLTRVTKMNGAALYSLADAPGTPKGVSIDTRGLTNNSTLRWTRDPHAESYQIVWRETNAPDWTHYISVGRTNQATVRLSKDNVVFGVRAVGPGGLKSPAAAPLPE